MSTSALDQHREQNARRSPRRRQGMIAEAGVEYIYYESVTITGRVVGKVVPARHVDRIAVAGVQQHRTAISNLQADRAGSLMGGGADAAEYTAVPDLDTFAVLLWDRSAGRFLCRLYEPDHRPEHAGALFAADSRGLLARLHWTSPLARVSGPAPAPSRR